MQNVSPVFVMCHSCEKCRCREEWMSEHLQHDHREIIAWLSDVKTVLHEIIITALSDNYKCYWNLSHTIKIINYSLFTAQIDNKSFLQGVYVQVMCTETVIWCHTLDDNCSGFCHDKITNVTWHVTVYICVTVTVVTAWQRAQWKLSLTVSARSDS